MPTEPVIPVDTREDLVSLLYEAAELEHGLCCSYLFAAFSLKAAEAAGYTSEQAAAVKRWRAVITEVAEEEMLHLALVSNLLTALGAAPHLRRPSFPQRSRYYPANITVVLRRFDDATLTRFLALERPDDLEIEEPLSVGADAARETGAGGMDPPDSAPGGLREPEDGPDAGPDAGPDEVFATVGHLYQTIERGLGGLVERLGPDDVFIGPPAAQATPAYFPFPELVAVTDLPSAQRALQTLVTQGEGVRGDWGDAHYGKFMGVRDEFRALQQDDPGFDPAWPVLDNPAISAVGAGRAVVEDPLAGAVMRLFNGCYELMTIMLLRCFAHTDEPEDALRALASGSVGLMTTAIGPLGGVLPTMPAGPSHPGLTAGASFEFYRSASLLPHRRAAWLVFHERLAELAEFAGRVHDQGGPDVLVGVADGVTAVRRELAEHLQAARPEGRG